MTAQLRKYYSYCKYCAVNKLLNKITTFYPRK